MKPSETSCMFLLKKMGTLHGNSNGMPLHQEFHYEPMST
jgi:hypothetical protein